MRKATARDADILRSGAEHDAVMDVCRRLFVANMMDIAICDVRAAHRQQLDAGNVGVMRFDTLDLQIVDKSTKNRRLSARKDWSERGHREIRQRYVLQHGNPCRFRTVADQVAVIDLVIKGDHTGCGVDAIDLLDLTGVL